MSGEAKVRTELRAALRELSRVLEVGVSRIETMLAIRGVMSLAARVDHDTDFLHGLLLEIYWDLRRRRDVDASYYAQQFARIADGL